MLFVMPKTSRAILLHVSQTQHTHTALVCFSSEVCRATCSQARLETGSGKDVAGHLENMISVRNISVTPPNTALCDKHILLYNHRREVGRSSVSVISV